MSQVHKEQLSEVDNALPNRSSLDIEIFGMEGVPEDVIQAHNQRVLTQFQQAEAERRAATGNPPPGVAKDGGPAKKPKLEMSELKKRLAEHKAKLAGENKPSEASSGSVTPVGAGQSAVPSTSQTPGSYVSVFLSSRQRFIFPVVDNHVLLTICIRRPRLFNRPQLSHTQ